MTVTPPAGQTAPGGLTQPTQPAMTQPTQPSMNMTQPPAEMPNQNSTRKLQYKHDFIDKLLINSYSNT